MKLAIILSRIFLPLIIPAVLCFGVAAEVFEVENLAFKVKLMGVKNHETGSTHYRLNVYDKTTQQESISDIVNVTTDVERIQIVRNQLVVFGYVDNLASGVTIIDLKKKQQKDFILGYHPQLSTTEKYLIYKKFYPRFSPEEIHSDLLLVYVLDQTPEENRVDDRKGTGEGGKGTDGHGYRLVSEEVGYPIYPEENVAKQRYFVWVPDPEERHLVTSSYLWLDEDNKVVFVDKTGGEVWLVAVDLSHGLDQAQSKKKLIDIASLIDIPKVMELDRITDPETALRDMKERIPIMGLRQKTEGNIVISIKQDWRYKATEIEMSLP